MEHIAIIFFQKAYWISFTTAKSYEKNYTDNAIWNKFYKRFRKQTQSSHTKTCKRSEATIKCGAINDAGTCSRVVERSIVVMYLQDATDDQILFKIRPVKAASPSIEELNDYIKLLDFAIQATKSKIQKATERMHSKFFAELDAAQIHFLSINNMQE